MQRINLITLFLLITLNTNGQSVISTQGDSYTNGTGNIDFTIGEVIISTESNGANDLTQGFHQTNWSFVGVENNNLEYTAVVYPNPIAELLNIKASHFEGVRYTMFDGNGRLVLENELTGDITSVQVGNLGVGNYTIVLTGKIEGPLVTFKLIKNL